MFDSIFGTGKLDKMIFQAYKLKINPEDPDILSTDQADTCAVQVNPDSYSISYQVQYERNNTAGAETPPKYKASSPSQLDFTIIFDGTGIIPASAGPLDNVPLVGAVAGLFSSSEEYDVMKEIKKFSLVTYAIKGTDHRPRKVQITWGRQIYDGVLTSISFNYKLFSPNGTPLRVEARVSFESAISDVMREATVKLESPDLTHRRYVIAGDTLPLLSDTIYGKTSYYIEVARTNKLYNFRKLKEGTAVFFPPTKKTK